MSNVVRCPQCFATRLRGELCSCVFTMTAVQQSDSRIAVKRHRRSSPNTRDFLFKGDECAKCGRLMASHGCETANCDPGGELLTPLALKHPPHDLVGGGDVSGVLPLTGDLSGSRIDPIFPVTSRDEHVELVAAREIIRQLTVELSEERKTRRLWEDSYYTSERHNATLVRRNNELGDKLGQLDSELKDVLAENARLRRGK